MTGKVTCPQCGASMAAQTHAGLTIDSCVQCGGVWFDLGELEALLETRGKLSKPGPSDEHLEHTQSFATQCPRCHARSLEEVSFRGVGLRACEQCRGMFVSQRSLDRILTRRRHEPGTSAADVADAALDAVIHAPDVSDALESIFDFFGDLPSGW